MSDTEVPRAFVWTKVQAEAGQPLEEILHRKRLEHRCGDTFWWGIGESKAEQIGLLLARNSRPAVLFSAILSRPHRRDSHPDGVLIWEEYETAHGDIPLPPHVVVTSRAHDSRGRPKTRHYALVCESSTEILHSGAARLDVGALRNFGEGGKPIGNSQVTAVVERIVGSERGPSYPITARATLAAPFAVKLTAQRRLSSSELQLLDDARLANMSTNDWAMVAKQLRRK
jgi:hypothetical protein